MNETRQPTASGLSLPLLSALTALALALGSGLSLFFNLPEGAQDFVFWQLRLPRLLIGLAVGSTLGLVGAAFQTLFQNPLATPSTLGTTAGASVGALLSLTLGLEGLGFLSAASLFAFAGALSASLVVVSVASRGTTRLEEVLLAGIAVTLASGAVSQALHAIASAPQLFAAAHWALGQLPQVGYDRVVLAGGSSLLASVIILGMGRSLMTLGLGEQWALSMGVAAARVRLIILLASCLGVGVAVALCGPIAFVGLLVPHIVRPALRGHSNYLLLFSWLGGGAFLVIADLLARSLIPGRELPVGALTAALGAPALFVVLTRRRKT